MGNGCLTLTPLLSLESLQQATQFFPGEEKRDTWHVKPTPNCTSLLRAGLKTESICSALLSAVRAMAVAPGVGKFNSGVQFYETQWCTDMSLILQ